MGPECCAEPNEFERIMGVKLLPWQRHYLLLLQTGRTPSEIELVLPERRKYSAPNQRPEQPEREDQAEQVHAQGDQQGGRKQFSKPGQLFLKHCPMLRRVSRVLFACCVIASIGLALVQLVMS